MPDVIEVLTPVGLSDIMQAAGYRAELIDDSVSGIARLRSATSGLNFEVRFGNRLAGSADGFADFSFVLFLQVVGDLPLSVVNKWNNMHRFSRLQLDVRNPTQSFLVLCMDIVVVGGITRSSLRAHIDIWDKLLQQFVAWLREELAPMRSANGAELAVAVDNMPDNTANSSAPLV
jgi:hypothetical protein